MTSEYGFPYGFDVCQVYLPQGVTLASNGLLH